MKLSISNIAWDANLDGEVYRYIKEKEFQGLEIAPTKLIQDHPYDQVLRAKTITKGIYEKYGLKISSMQSIWFGMNQNIFNEEEKRFLLGYTKQAILFAEAIDCHNLVFGCPQNRSIPEGKSVDYADNFFIDIANYASKHNTCIALEANPVIYHTNFINTTDEAFMYAKRLNCEGLKVNIDLGTMIYNQEELSILEENIKWINHIHISEPFLAKIEHRELHCELRDLLERKSYNGYISIEMKTMKDITDVKSTLDYVSEVFK